MNRYPALDTTPDRPQQGAASSKPLITRYDAIMGQEWASLECTGQAETVRTDAWARFEEMGRSIPPEVLQQCAVASA